MPYCKAIPCITKGCLNYAADDIRYSGLCPLCYQRDCELPDNDQLIESDLIKDARMYADMIKDGKNLHTREETAAVSLARVTSMLALYGSKPESILDVIHQRGWTDVTIDDVHAVRNYVLGE